MERLDRTMTEGPATDGRIAEREDRGTKEDLRECDVAKPRESRPSFGDALRGRSLGRTSGGKAKESSVPSLREGADIP